MSTVSLGIFRAAELVVFEFEGDYIYHRHSTLADQIRATCMECEGVESRVLFGFCNRYSILVAQLCVTYMKCEGLEHCALFDDICRRHSTLMVQLLARRSEGAETERHNEVL